MQATNLEKVNLQQGLRFQWGTVLEERGSSGSTKKMDGLYTGRVIIFELVFAASNLALAHLRLAASTLSSTQALELPSVEAMQAAGKSCRAAAGVCDVVLEKFLPAWTNAHPLLPIECQAGGVGAVRALALAQAQALALCVGIVRGMAPPTLARVALGAASLFDVAADRSAEMPQLKRKALVLPVSARSRSGGALLRAIAARFLAWVAAAAGEHGEAAVAMTAAAERGRRALAACREAAAAEGRQGDDDGGWRLSVGAFLEQTEPLARSAKEDNAQIYMMLEQMPSEPKAAVIAKANAWAVRDPRTVSFAAAPMTPAVAGGAAPTAAGGAPPAGASASVLTAAAAAAAGDDSDSDFDLPSPGGPRPAVGPSPPAESGRALLQEALSGPQQQQAEAVRQQQLAMQASLQKYQQVTGVTDFEQARAALAAHGWNVRSAVNAHFNPAAF
jgi:hypothetical protein